MDRLQPGQERGGHRQDRGHRGGRAFRGNQSRRHKNEPPTADEQTFNAWSQHVPRALAVSKPTPLSELKLISFYQTAWALVAKDDASLIHQVIRALATDGGLQRISELTYSDLGAATSVQGYSVFQKLHLPFMRVITHTDVISSPLLEQDIGNIYIFLYGVRGRRASKFFTLCADYSIHAHKSAGTENNATAIAELVTVLATFANLLQCSQNASIDAQLRPIVDTLQPVLDEAERLFEGTLEAQDASKHMRVIRQYLDYGAKLDNLPQQSEILKAQSATFQFEVEAPGRLSKAGIRHDNDHAAIKDIKILPTAEEISSDRPEYLPVKDPSKWHLQGVEGLIDQQFRLLREDTVGQLRDCVRTLLQDLKQPLHKHTYRGYEKSMRIYKYDNVTFSDVQFHNKYRLQVAVEFDQPKFVSNKAYRHRRRWWEECKQLQVDAFICAVDSDGNTLFFSVAERRGMSPQKYSKGAEEESLSENEESQDVPNLYKDSNRATITLRLIDLPSQSLSPILSRGKRARKVEQCLVEFPGVLLPAFQPTLEALQRMTQKNTTIPFSSLLLPEHSSAASETRIDWPNYAKQPGFYFDLSPILTRGLPLKLQRSSTFNTHALMERSTLDEAQCKALVGILTRNLAFVQGPPGTGKSYVAVQIMKILLRHREKTKMGPIIIV